MELTTTLGAQLEQELKASGLGIERPRLVVQFHELSVQKHGRNGNNNGGRKHKALLTTHQTSSEDYTMANGQTQKHTDSDNSKQDVAGISDEASLAAHLAGMNRLLINQQEFLAANLAGTKVIGEQVMLQGSIKREAIKLGIYALTTTAVAGAAFATYTWIAGPSVPNPVKKV